MLDTPEAVFEALRENNERPYGLQRTVTAEELVEAAEPFDKPDILVTALMELMEAYEHTGEHRKSPVVFARLLKLWEDAPGAFSEWEAHQVLWRFKWVTTSLLQVPEVPLATVEGWIGRMRERYEADGHGVQPVAAMRYQVAAHTGAGTDAAYDLWATRPRTRLSDCEACETRHHALHRVRAGDDAAALEVWRPVLEGDSSCSDEPQMNQAQALLPLVRSGRLDEARSHHLSGYRRVRGMSGMQDEVGLHLEFCALTRNEGRGLEILAENRPLFEAVGAPLARLGFLTGVEVLLARLVAGGHADAPVAGPPGRSWTAGELLETVRAEGDSLAAAFDARNGTTGVGDRRRARLACAPLTGEPLPLGLRTAAAGAVSGSGAGGNGAFGAPAAPVIPEDFVELVQEARRMAALGHPGDTPLWQRIAAVAGEDAYVHDDRLGPEGRLRAELVEQRAYELFGDDRETEAVAAMTEAAGLFGAAGLAWDALVCRARALAWGSVRRSGGDSGSGDGAAGGSDGASDAGVVDRAGIRAGLDAVLREAEELAASPGSPSLAAPADRPADAARAAEAADVAEQYLTVVYFRVYGAYHEAVEELPEVSAATLERFEETVALLRSEAERLAVPHRKAGALEFTADLALRRGEPERAEGHLRAALEEVEASGRPWAGIRTRSILAQTLFAQGKYGEAVEPLHQVIALAVRHGASDFPLVSVHAMLGHAASHVGDTATAVRHLSEAAARHDRSGAHDAAADMRLQLADVLTHAGRPEEAVAVLESVDADESGALDGRLHAQVRLTLGRGLRALEEHRAAAEVFLRLADTVADWEDAPEVLTLVASEAAVSLAAADRWDAARAAYARAVDAHAKAANPPVIIRMMCEFARLTPLGERPGTEDAEGPAGLAAALAHLAEADAVCAAVPPDTDGFSHAYESGTIHYQRARVLASAERFTDALAEAEASVAAHERDGEQGEVPRAESVRVAAVIEYNGLGRASEAMARLSAAAKRCRRHGLDEAAQILDALRVDFRARQSDR
ncbi:MULTISPECIES: hypothetical protein [Streptomyces]|uniref:hypothetical protein n=1 Tax=Streptomyces TaxID=1883 RepID=UPI00167B3595|nr:MULTISPECIES: hypothetical protein [Streptomyces]MBD3575465.1 hypothetical protein [Streptomyces sp. KD18]GGS93469.1 hypothetical protein GCM10010286_17880 [Streptomyces toxytricini]